MRKSLILLKERLQALFPEKNAMISDPLFIRGMSSDEEVLAATEAFIGKQWSQIDVGVWYEHRNALALMPAPASCYYLPALIMASVLEPKSSACAVEDLADTLDSLGDPEKRALRDFEWMQLDLGQLFFIAGWL